MGTPFLFVYGTLRRCAGNEMTSLLAKNAEFIGNASYQGRLYLIDGYPGAVPSDMLTDLVHGEAYRLHNPGWLLTCLDVYEECGQGFPEPTEYVRKLRQVRLYSGENILAWIYLYNRPTENLVLLPSGNFQNTENCQ